MTKALIKSVLGGAAYSVQLKFNNASAINNSDRIADEIVKLAGPIANAQLDLLNKEAEADVALAAVRAAIVEAQNENKVPEPSVLLPLQRKLAEISREIVPLRLELSTLQAEKAHLSKAKTTLDNHIAADNRSSINIYCADWTLDLAVDAEIFIPLVPGELTGSTLVVAPAYEAIDSGRPGKAATWNWEEHGWLTPSYNINAAQNYYNWAMKPGWQRWTPHYRYAKILNRRKEWNLGTLQYDWTADIEYDEILSNETKRVGSQTVQFSVNGSDNPPYVNTFVPFEYLSCNGDPFEVDDRVLVQMRDKDWSDPLIIGFRDRPYDKDKCVYEFASDVSSASNFIGRWFKVFQDRDGEAYCLSYPNNSRFELEPSFRTKNDTQNVGANRTGVNRSHCNVWYGPKDEQGYRTAYGAGDMFARTDSENPNYGNYVIDTVSSTLPYWFHLVGKDGLTGASSAVCETVTKDGQFRVQITPTGTVTVIRVSDNTRKKVRVSFPDKVRTHEFTGGNVWGAWRANPAGDTFVSVLHGNPILGESIGHDDWLDAKLNDDSQAPYIRYAFMSFIFTVKVSITGDANTTNWKMSARARQYGKERFVGCAGTRFGRPEKKAKGTYYYGADWDRNRIVFAYADVEAYDFFKWEDKGSACGEGSGPYCTAEAVENSGYDNPDSKGGSGRYCGTNSGNLGFYTKGAAQFQVSWQAPGTTTQWTYIRKKKYRIDLRFSNSGQRIPLRYISWVRTFEENEGYRGTYDLDYRTHEAGVVSHLSAAEGLIMQQVAGPNPSGSVGELCLGAGEGVAGGSMNAVFSDLATYKDRFVFEDEKQSDVIYIDIPGRVYAWSERTWKQNDDFGTAYEHPGSGIKGLFQYQERQRVQRFHLRSPQKDVDRHQASATLDPVAEDIVDQPWWGSLGRPRTETDHHTDEDQYFIGTARMWPCMIFGAPNPNTPEGFGTKLGMPRALADIHYMPRLMATGHAAGTSHPDGHYSFTGGLQDIIYMRGGFETTHLSMMKNALAKQSPSMIAAARAANPGMTREEATEYAGALNTAIIDRLKNSAILARGQWAI